MTPEEQRIAIAEACGWRYHQDAPIDMKEAAIMCWIRPGGEFWQSQCLPDYLNDLNAMHDAEKVLTEEQRSIYCYHLLPDKEQAFEREDVWIGTHATAAQRAEALLRTIGKWKE